MLRLVVRMGNNQAEASAVSSSRKLSQALTQKGAADQSGTGLPCAGLFCVLSASVRRVRENYHLGALRALQGKFGALLAVFGTVG